MKTFKTLQRTFDLAFIDSDKRNNMYVSWVLETRELNKSHRIFPRGRETHRVIMVGVVEERPPYLHRFRLRSGEGPLAIGASRVA